MKAIVVRFIRDEQGQDLVWVVWRGFYAPPDISEQAYQQWVERLRAMSQTREWKAMLEHNGLTPFFLGGQEFERFVTERAAAYRKISEQIGIIP